MGERDERADGDDAYDRDLERDNLRDRGGSTMGELVDPTTRGGASGAGTPASLPHVEGGEEHRQHSRKGQAQSPVELTHNEQPKRKEGHGEQGTGRTA